MTKRHRIAIVHPTKPSHPISLYLLGLAWTILTWVTVVSVSDGQSASTLTKLSIGIQSLALLGLGKWSCPWRALGCLPTFALWLLQLCPLQSHSLGLRFRSTASTNYRKNRTQGLSIQQAGWRVASSKSLSQFIKRGGILFVHLLYCF